STVGSGGVFNGSGTDVEANLTPTVQAWISTNVTVYVGAVNQPRLVTLDPSEVNTDTDSLTDPDLVGLTTGEALTYHQGTGNGAGPLMDGKMYFAIVDPSRPGQIQLAATQDDALHNIAIDLTSVGDNVNQSMTFAQSQVIGVDVEATSLRA